MTLSTLSIFEKTETKLHEICLRRNNILNEKNWQYLCVISGQLWGLSILLAMVAASMFPPPSPTWDANYIHQHYFSHKTGTEAAAVLLILAGGFYMPFGAVISKQMRLIKNVDPILCDLQLISCGSTAFSFIMPGIFLSLITFCDYGPETTQLLNDLFWLGLLIQWPTLWIQNWTLAWAILGDRSDKPRFPKLVGILNVFAPIAFAGATGLHTQLRGPFAWNGAFAFWIPVATLGIQLSADCVCLVRNIRRMDANGEDIDN